MILSVWTAGEAAKAAGYHASVLSKITVCLTGDLLLKRLGSALEWLLEMRFCLRMTAPAHAQLMPRQSNGAYASRV